MADDDEYIQLTVPEVFVYKLPPRASAQGHKCVAGVAAPAVIAFTARARGRVHSSPPTPRGAAAVAAT